MLNLACLWLRSYSTARKTGFRLALAGAVFVIVSSLRVTTDYVTLIGVSLLFTGSLLNARNH